MIRRIFQFILSSVFLLNAMIPAWAQSGALLPMMSPHAAAQSPEIEGVKVFTLEPFRFEFIVSGAGLSSGKRGAANSALRDDSSRLIKYFFTSLALPEKDLWVNLSPLEPDRILTPEFARTAMGRDLLAQDLVLKQMTASFLSPDNKIGRAFWDKVYAQLKDRYGSVDIPVDAINKVWIMPGKAVVYEKSDDLNSGNVSALILESRLNVMAETDYWAMSASMPIGGHDVSVISNSKGEGSQRSGISYLKEARKDDVASDIARSVLRDIVIPALEEEVNNGKDFAPLRQVYHSLILAAWYKRKMKESFFSKVYIDRRSTNGIERYKVESPANLSTESIFQQYLSAYRAGLKGMIVEEPDALSGEMIPRKYATGGILGDMTSLRVTTDVSRGAAKISALSLDSAVVGVWANPLREIPGSAPADAAQVPVVLRSTINAVIGQIYADVEALPKETPSTEPAYRSRWCLMVAELLQQRIKGVFPQTHLVVYRDKQRKDVMLPLHPGERIDEHAFLLTFWQDRVFIIDATWQQFLKPAQWTAGMPRVLMVDLKGLVTTLSSYGVAYHDRLYWLNGLWQNEELLAHLRRMPGYNVDDIIQDAVNTDSAARRVEGNDSGLLAGHLIVGDRDLRSVDPEGHFADLDAAMDGRHSVEAGLLSKPVVIGSGTLLADPEKSLLLKKRTGYVEERIFLLGRAMLPVDAVSSERGEGWIYALERAKEDAYEIRLYYASSKAAVTATQFYGDYFHVEILRSWNEWIINTFYPYGVPGKVNDRYRGSGAADVILEYIARVFEKKGEPLISDKHTSYAAMRSWLRRKATLHLAWPRSFNIGGVKGGWREITPQALAGIYDSRVYGGVWARVGTQKVILHLEFLSPGEYRVKSIRSPGRGRLDPFKELSPGDIVEMDPLSSEIWKDHRVWGMVMGFASSIFVDSRSAVELNRILPSEKRDQDAATTAGSARDGGIDFATAKVPLEVRQGRDYPGGAVSAGGLISGISGIIPVIVFIKPAGDLGGYLGRSPSRAVFSIKSLPGS